MEVILSDRLWPFFSLCFPGHPGEVPDVALSRATSSRSKTLSIREVEVFSVFTVRVASVSRSSLISTSSC
ncbi:hypothetical protein GDO81_029104 [Engystomops pustulosus]|uniref:Secreted protein n=1 Tax=Engystomops pustulosus TaxID=76066 RepID=A0AAV6ZUS8_ENGPU|nr:hypothetical protein GDO81_029104 [Engystomops pustulosus]